MKSYSINPELDEKIRVLIAAAGDSPNQDLTAEMVTTVLKLFRDKASRGDMKLVNTALKEMRYSLLTFARHFEPKVTIFGSARILPEDSNYQLAAEIASIMGDKGWGVITGAGPGIMEAGSRGASRDHAYGVNIRLPFEDEANSFIDPERNVNYKYFFTRKLTFVKESAAFVLFPGGFGTLDETFELFTLMQTGKSDLHPIVLMEAPGTGYWPPLLEFCSNVLTAKGLISPADMNLFMLTGDSHDAANHILDFYSNYHSQRYVEGRLILRLHRAPDPSDLESINEEFADIVVSGSIDLAEPSLAEINDGDNLDLARLGLHFDRRSYGRLRLLIDRVNTLVVTPDHVEPPPPFQEEQAERPW
ncbi:MAG: TIGR00730 family Rossman fold protein [Acidimicrobiia bacterium]